MQHPSAPHRLIGQTPPPITVSGPYRSPTFRYTEHDVWKLSDCPLENRTLLSALKPPWAVKVEPSVTENCWPLKLTVFEAPKLPVIQPKAKP